MLSELLSLTIIPVPKNTSFICISHIIYFDTICVNDNIAFAHAYRTGYLPGDRMHGEEKYLNYVIARYDLAFVKEFDNWKLQKLNYYPGFLIRPFSENTFISETR